MFEVGGWRLEAQRLTKRLGGQEAKIAYSL
jgi:hypothetical protein